MFGTVRKHSQPLWIVIIIMVVISFVVYFTPGFDPLDNSGRSSTSTDLTEARDMALLEYAAIGWQNDPQRMQAIQTAQMMMQFAQQQGNQQIMQNAQRQLQQALSPPPVSANDQLSQNQSIDLNQDGVMDTDFHTYRAHLRIRQLNKAHDLGIRIGRDTAVKWNETNFNNDGKFDTAAFDNEIKRLSDLGYIPAGEQGKERYREMIRQFLTLQQLSEVMSQSVGLFPDEFASAELQKQNTEYTTHAVFFSLSNHLATATAASTNATSLTNVQQHYETLVNEYAIPAKRKIGYVKFDAAHFRDQAAEDLDIKTQIEQRIELHNSSTNTFDHLLDDNGTKYPPGPALQLAAREAVQETYFFKQQLYSNIRTNHLLSETKQMYLDIYRSAPPKELAHNPALHWSIANLKRLVKEHKGNVPLEYKEAEVTDPSSPKADNELPPAVVNEVFGRNKASTGKGLLYRLDNLLEADGEGFFFIGFIEDIPLKIRAYGELTAEEQAEVQNSFAKAEADRLLDEEVVDFSESVQLLMETGKTFAEVIQDKTYPAVNLSPLKLSATTTATNELNQLEGHAPLTSILTAVKSAGDEAKAGWTSPLTRNPGSMSDGFVVHVSAVTEGQAPSPVELTNHADNLRRTAESSPVWFQAEAAKLRDELVATAIASRLETIDADIVLQEDELKKFSADLERYRKNPNLLPEGITVEALEEDHTKNTQALEELKALKTRLQGGSN